ncbi:MAG TPA: peptide-methionine (R)-S-oxide reductase MsrB [Devosia sp.]|nr:peptide-methionine (R)-S-oxide reductase MsrB [Devosia sp.]
MASFDRRSLLLGGTALAGLLALPVVGRAFAAGSGPVPGDFEVTRTEEEWLALLGPEAYEVMRNQGTERPWSSALLDEHREGVFVCAGCELPLFDSATKYDSHTGWPSFYQPLDNAVGTMTDTLLGYERTEVHCRRCGGHLGHVFNDGPAPTGLRYCMDGVALKFVPRAA